VTKQERYLRALKRGEKLSVRGVFGRIIRTSQDIPVKLSEDEQRKVVMVMGPHALSDFLELCGYEMLVKLGYTHEYIAANLAKGVKFKLVVFERPQPLKVATWKGLVSAAAKQYPELACVLTAALPQLKKKTLSEFEREAGYRFAEVQSNGSSDPRFMTPARLKASAQTACDVRQFLFHTLNCSDLYTGTGFTQTTAGQTGVREYVIPNGELKEMRNCAIADLLIDETKCAKHATQ
jgi:hypothetical protein